MNAIILSGGKCSRISITKSFIKLGNKTIIEDIIDTLTQMFDSIIVVANEQEKYSELKVSSVVRDIIPHKGPLGGIYTGLVNSDSIYNFVVACDMPFIESQLISLLLNHIDGYDIIVPEYNGFIEPLYGIYSKNCINIILDHIKKNDLKVRNIFQKLKVKYVDCNRLPDAHNAFFNINTPKDLDQARRNLKLI